MIQFNDDHSTAVSVKGLTPKKISNNILVVGRHRMKYLTEAGRDRDFERQLKNK